MTWLSEKRMRQWSLPGNVLERKRFYGRRHSEVALFEQGKLTATVVAQTDCTLLEITRHDFRRREKTNVNLEDREKPVYSIQNTHQGGRNDLRAAHL
jgi:hypothetical protein